MTRNIRRAAILTIILFASPAFTLASEINLSPVRAVFYSSNGNFEFRVTEISRGNVPTGTVELRGQLSKKNSKNEFKPLWIAPMMGNSLPDFALPHDDGKFLIAVSELEEGAVFPYITAYDTGGRIAQQWGARSIFSEEAISTMEDSSLPIKSVFLAAPFLDNERDVLVLPTIYGFITLDPSSGRASRFGMVERFDGWNDTALLKALSETVEELTALTENYIGAPPDPDEIFGYKLRILHLVSLIEKMVIHSTHPKKLDEAMREAIDRATAIYAPELNRRFADATIKGKIAMTRAKIRGIQTALEQFYIDFAAYPLDREGLDVLIRSDFPLLEPDMIIDSWGRPFYYKNDPRLGTYEIRSSGPDRKFDTADDLK